MLTENVIEKKFEKKKNEDEYNRYTTPRTPRQQKPICITTAKEKKQIVIQKILKKVELILQSKLITKYSPNDLDDYLRITKNHDALKHMLENEEELVEIIQRYQQYTNKKAG